MLLFRSLDGLDGHQTVFESVSLLVSKTSMLENAQGCTHTFSLLPQHITALMVQTDNLILLLSMTPLILLMI